jgi:uncharacterized delta-60 repeat protein
MLDSARIKDVCEVSYAREIARSNPQSNLVEELGMNGWNLLRGMGRNGDAARGRRNNRSRKTRPQLEVYESRLLLAAGAFDPGFGAGSGFVTYPIAPGSGADTVTDVAIQDDGKTVLVGATWDATAGPQLLITRLNADGTLDTDFGSSGRRIIDGVSSSASPRIVMSPGPFVLQAGALETNENGVSAQYTLTLSMRPTADVSFTLTSSNPQEGTVSPSSITFTPDDWNVPKVVTVTGVDDAVADGAKTYRISSSPAVSADSRFQGLRAPNVELINRDNETPGVTVIRSADLTTTPEGKTTQFSLVLNRAPAGIVSITLTGSDPTQGVIDKTNVVFTGANWNIPQVVTVTGVDNVGDFQTDYRVVTSATISTSSQYNGLPVADVFITQANPIPSAARAVALQTVAGQQKILVLGTLRRPATSVIPQESTELVLYRFNPNGQLDTSFGDTDPANPGQRTGRFTFNSDVLASSGIDRAYGLTVAPDGPIFINGSYNYDLITNINTIFTLQLTPNGVLDTSSNSIGASLTESGASYTLVGGELVGYYRYDEMRAIAVANADTLYQAGFVRTPTGNVEMAVLKMQRNRVVRQITVNGTVQNVTFAPGTLYPDFGTAGINPFFGVDPTNRGGVSVIPFDLGGTNTDVANALLIDGDGTLLVAGSGSTASGSMGILARVHPDTGTLIGSFGSGGKLVLNQLSGITGMRLQSDGKILLSGYRSTPGGTIVAMVRLNANGSLDGTFGAGGVQELGRIQGTVAAERTGGLAYSPSTGTAVVGATVVTPTGGADLGAGRVVVQPSLVSMAAPSVTVQEGNTVTVNAVRSGSLDHAFTVQYSIVFASASGYVPAQAGVDYTGPLNGTLTFGPGVGTVPINISTAYVQGVQAPRLLQVVLSNPSAFGQVGSIATTNVSIEDVDYTPPAANPAGTFIWERPLFSVNETGTGSVTVRLVRAGGSAGAVSAILTLGGTAVAGTDYTAPPTTVLFADGEVAKSLVIPIANRPGVQGDRTIVLTVTGTSGGAGIASGATQKATTITIRDTNTAADPPPRITTVASVLGTTRATQRKVVALRVTFNEPLNMGNASTSSVALDQFQLMQGVRRRGVLNYTQAISIKSASYDPATNSILITLTRAASRKKSWQLTINPRTLVGMDTQLVDGDEDSTPGGTFVRRFVS